VDTSLSDPGAIALANAIGRRIPALLNRFRQREPLFSRSPTVRARGRRIQVPVDLGSSSSLVATYNLASLFTGFAHSVGFLGSLDNDAYFNLVADRLAAQIVREQSRRTVSELYGDERDSGLLGLSTYAPAENSDEWIGGIPPETPGWLPQLSVLCSMNPAATVQALFDLSLACTDDLCEPTIIAAGPRLARDVLRGFQPQQRFRSFHGGVSYLRVGMADMFSTASADDNAAFVLHPCDFEFHHAPPLVTASGGRFLARVDQQLVCRRRYALGRLQRYECLYP
jgi:hypothetical protein